MTKTAILALEDGSIFRGTAIGYDAEICGEVVFNTAMTGYQEILTDPSYYRQIITLTYPHIGNTGINRYDQESNSVHAAGLVIRDLPLMASNWRSEQSLNEYLILNKIIGIADIDTRRLTRVLRNKGVQRGCLVARDGIDESTLIAKAQAFPGLKGQDLAEKVTTISPYGWQEGEWCLELNGYKARSEFAWHVVVYDFGVKQSMLRMLSHRGCLLTVVPAKTSAKEVLKLKPDGIFLSNGPGDPEPCIYAIEAIRELLDACLPIFGICLGHQLLALASGAKTEKMKFGHHGANHPVQNLDTQQVMITSQNHGFVVSESTLPYCLRATHRSLFDGSLQGVERVDKPAFSFQGHPEASPGPHDADVLFDRFVGMLENHTK